MRSYKTGRSYFDLTQWKKVGCDLQRRTQRCPDGWERIPMRPAEYCSKKLKLPNFRDYAVKVPEKGTESSESNGSWVNLRGHHEMNFEIRIFALMGRKKRVKRARGVVDE